jgi:transposase
MESTKITVKQVERDQLNSWVRSSTTEQRLAFRARVVLRLADNASIASCARDERTTALTVRKWRDRFLAQRLSGLVDAARPGKPRTYGESTERRILALLDEPPPEGYARWNGTLLAQALGDVSHDHVWRVLREHRISLERRHSWCVSTDPEFAAKAADIVGLYLNPPEHAVVLCMDEKPSIQALERAQGWLRLPNGKALTGFSHCYKRHGTTTLFAAIEVATGLVKTGHYKRRRRREFLDFMNEVVDQYPKREIHVVLDNLNTHKPKRDLWLARHPNVHFHFTPTYSSWLNQVEVWFSLLSRHALTGASFTDTHQVRAQIDAFTRAHNHTAAPFEWTKTVVHQKVPKAYVSNLRN